MHHSFSPYRCDTGLFDQHVSNEVVEHEELESIDAFIHLDECKWGLSYYFFINGPLYDTNTEGCQIAKCWPREQPSRSMEYEEPYQLTHEPTYVQGQKGDFHIQDPIETL